MKIPLEPESPLRDFSNAFAILRNFRSRIAYNRWWEGGTLLQQTRGEWFNGFSSLIVLAPVYPDSHNSDLGVSINGGTPIAGWFIRGQPIKMDDLGVPLFQETFIYW